jgi:hypothetical protein
VRRRRHGRRRPLRDLLRAPDRDLRVTDAENAFRQEVRAGFRDHLPPEIRQRIVDGRRPSKEDYRRWTKILHV